MPRTTDDVDDPPTMAECTHCHAEISDEESTIFEREPYCEDCFNDHFFTCESCDDIYSNDEEHMGDDLPFCESCFDESFSPCARCSETVANNDSYHIEDYGAVCDSCYQDHFSMCDYCERRFPSDDMCDLRGDWVCHYCYENRDHNDDGNEYGIHEYDYRPTFVFSGKGPLFFGLELEIEFKGDHDDTVKICGFLANYEWIYLKHDGSLSNGIELVTHPATFEVFCTRKKEIKEILKYLKSHGARSFNTDTCGVHVQFSRRAVTRCEEIKISHFIAEYPKQCEVIAQRGSVHFSKNGKKKLFDYHKNLERYSAVNFCNKKTVEFRLFKGTLDFDSFWSYLVFSRALVGFVKSVPIRYCTWRHFCDFLTKDKDYKELVSRLRQKGILCV